MSNNEKMKHVLKTDNFFGKYAPVTNHKHKLRGKSGRGKPLDFSDADRKQIIQGLQNMCDDLINDLKKVKK